MNRKEFQKWLDQFPEDTIIDVVIDGGSDSWTQLPPDRVQFDPEKEFYHWDYTDYEENPLIIKDDPSYNKRVLVLGSDD